jgi:hypothetical protein
MITEVFIENKRLDITQELDYLITYAVDDIKDFEHKQSNFSKTIILPGTANNNKLFGHIFDARVSNSYDSTEDNVSTNFNASVAADCLIFQNRLQVFKGTLRILEIVIREGQIEYEVAVFGELGSLVGELGYGKLEDLDFSLYDHVWNGSNITSSWENVTGGGYYYPLVDYGTTSVAKVDYDIRTFRPALFVREYIDKMLTDAGYTWESDLMNTQRFKNLIVPNNQKSLQIVTNRLLEAVDVSTQTIIQNAVDDEAPIPTALNTLTGNFTYLGGVFTYTGAHTRQFRLEATINGDYYSTIESIQLGIKKNGVQVYTQVPFLPPTFGTTNTNYTSTFPSVYLSLATGDTIELFAKVANNVGSYHCRTTFVNFGAYLAIPTYVDATVGGTLTMNDLIPKNILKKDFLSSVIKLFNLYVYEDRLIQKKLLIKPYVDFYDLNVSGVTDWTYKVDRSRDIRLKPMSELNSRIYNFNFKADNDYYNELYRKTYNQEYGNYKYDSGYEFANDTTNIDLIFSPSVLVGYAGVDKIVTAMYKKNAGVEETFATNIRILQAKKVTGVASWKIKNGVSDLITGLTVYGYGGHYDDPDAPANDIHFGVPSELYFTLVTGAVNVTQFNVYWSPYMAEITDKDSKLLTCYMKLTNSDIFNLNFGTIIYVDGSYWRLNKIEDYNANSDDVCKVELLKVVNLLY